MMMIKKPVMQNAKCKMQTRTRTNAFVCMSHFALRLTLRAPRARSRCAFCIALVLLIGSNGHAQFGGGANSELQLVARYDKDKNGRLNREERTAARAAVGGQQQFFRRGGFGNGAVSVTPGRKMTPADVRPYPTTSDYDLGTLRTIFLQFENA